MGEGVFVDGIGEGRLGPDVRGEVEAVNGWGEGDGVGECGGKALGGGGLCGREDGEGVGWVGGGEGREGGDGGEGGMGLSKGGGG